MRQSKAQKKAVSIKFDKTLVDDTQDGICETYGFKHKECQRALEKSLNKLADEITKVVKKEGKHAAISTSLILNELLKDENAVMGLLVKYSHEIKQSAVFKSFSGMSPSLRKKLLQD